MASNKMVTDLSTYNSCTLYCLLMAVYLGMELLTSDCMLLPILAPSSFTHHFSMCILGHIVGGCIGSVAVNYLVSALLMCLGRSRIG